MAWEKGCFDFKRKVIPIKDEKWICRNCGNVVYGKENEMPNINNIECGICGKTNWTITEVSREFVKQKERQRILDLIEEWIEEMEVVGLVSKNGYIKLEKLISKIQGDSD